VAPEETAQESTHHADDAGADRRYPRQVRDDAAKDWTIDWAMFENPCVAAAAIAPKAWGSWVRSTFALLMFDAAARSWPATWAATAGAMPCSSSLCRRIASVTASSEAPSIRLRIAASSVCSWAFRAAVLASVSSAAWRSVAAMTAAKAGGTCSYSSRSRRIRSAIAVSVPWSAPNTLRDSASRTC